MKTIACLYAALCLLPVGTAGAQYAPIVERNVAVKMRDGVILRADVYRPETPGKFPVILQRTPYNRVMATGFGLKLRRWSMSGLCRTVAKIRFRRRLVSLGA